MPNLNTGIVEAVPVPVLPRELQRAAARTLNTIDDLIENNRRRVALLEEMARALYKEWFVHYRFPGHEQATFTDSPLGPIPKNWDAGVLADICTVSKATVDPSSVDPGTPLVGLEHIPRRQVTLNVWGSAGDIGSRKA